MINQSANMMLWLKATTGRIMWMGSCCAFMWLMPMGFEMIAEQNKILAKHTMNQMMQGDHGPMGGMPPM